MFESGRWGLFKGLAAAVCILAVTWIALDYFIPAPPSEFSIATGFQGGSAEFIGNRYKERLAHQNMKVEVLLTDGSGENFKLLQNPKSGVKVAVIQSGVSSSKEMPGLLSLGRVNYQVFWIFYRAIETLDDLTQLKGKRISVGPEGSGTRTVAMKLLASSGVNSENAQLSPLAGLGAAEALKEGSLDVMFLANTSDAPLYKSLLRDPDIRVMNLRRAEALTRIYPFLVRLVLPEGVVDLVRNIPATDLNVVAATNAVVIREDIHPAIVGLLAEAMYDEHSGAREYLKVPGRFPRNSIPNFLWLRALAISTETALHYYHGLCRSG
jgi:TRAP transporter TAXI family solute receptor